MPFKYWDQQLQKLECLCEQKYFLYPIYEFEHLDSMSSFPLTLENAHLRV